MSCPDCFRGGLHDHLGEAKGTIETLHGSKCYVASPASTSTSTSVIIYITDSFGLNIINGKLLADRLAEDTSCKVLMPDVIPGGGAPLSLMHYTEIMETPVTWYNLPGWLRRGAAAVAVGWYLIPLIFNIYTSAAPERVYPKTILPFARAVRADLPPGAKLGVVGFCWGGYGSVNLCAEPAIAGGSERLIDVQFCGHPYKLTVPEMVIEAVRKWKVPFSMAIGDHDRFFPKQKVEETEAALRREVGRGDGEGEGGYRYEIKVYEGCTHGFVVRAKVGSEVENAAAEKARAQAVAWLKSYL
jgi:dienelactone hydrolase